MNKKHGWDKSCGIYYCSDGIHSSFWQTVIQSRQWKEWYKYQMKHPSYDIDESQECGWLSGGHFEAFMKYTNRKVFIPLKGKIK